MRGLFLNIILALCWLFVTGDFSPNGLIIGMLLGYLVLLFTQRLVGEPTYGLHVWRAIELLLFFLYEMLLANGRVARDVLRAEHHLKPGIVAVPLDIETDVEILLLTTLVALTPGTMNIAVSDTRDILFVHALDAENPEELRRQIKEGFERRVLGVLR